MLLCGDSEDIGMRPRFPLFKNEFGITHFDEMSIYTLELHKFVNEKSYKTKIIFKRDTHAF